MKAISIWKDGDKWYMLRDDDGTFSHAVATKDEATEEGATIFIETEEPRFLVRDESGRGWKRETLYTEFTAEDREHKRDDDDEYCETLGDWLDNDNGDEEYDNSDDNVTIIRIN